MMNQLLRVVTLLFILAFQANALLSQSTNPEFLNCNQDSIYELCIADEGIRLPQNNLVFLGPNHPDASSCSVHVSRHKKVRSTCGQILNYEVLLFKEGSAQGIVLQVPTTIVVDSFFEADLTFDSEHSPEIDISQNGIPYSSCQPHKIKWIVRDSCGNENSCEEKLDLFDCNPPLFSLTDSFYIFHTNNTGHVRISVDTIISSLLDDCGEPNEFLFSLSEHSYQTDSLLYVCDIPAFGVGVPWNFWIADKGRDLNCDGTITWFEKHRVLHQFNIIFLDDGSLDCEDWRVLSGNITTYDNQSIAKAEVSVYDQEVLIASQITGPDGKYYFGPETMLPENYTIKVRRNDNHKNGVTTTDIVTLVKHLLGIKTFTNPYHLIASEVNNSLTISAIDIIEIRKLILGINSEFPNSPSWKFIPADFVLNTQSPWPFPEEVSVIDAPNTNNQDFIGIKMGDLNGTVTPD